MPSFAHVVGQAKGPGPEGRSSANNSQGASISVVPGIRIETEDSSDMGEVDVNLRSLLLEAANKEKNERDLLSLQVFDVLVVTS